MSRFHIGTISWSYGFWARAFCSDGLEAENYLTDYSKHFKTFEVDSTFYRIPYETTV